MLKSYPGHWPLIRNAWSFTSPGDKTGSEVTGLTRLNRFQQPADSIYFADNENGSWRPVITALGANGSLELNDVWSASQLPYSAGGKSINGERRVARARHGRGPNLLYFDGHAGLKKAEKITVDDWREQRN